MAESRRASSRVSDASVSDASVSEDAPRDLEDLRRRIDEADREILARLNERAELVLEVEGLVESVSKDIRPRVVLDEWLRLGVARIELVDDQELVRLNVEAFVPASGFDEKAFYFGRNLRDHIATAAGNLAGVDPSRLERSVYYDDLTAEST